MRRRWLIVGLILLLAALVVWGIWPRPSVVAVVYVRGGASEFPVPPDATVSQSDIDTIRQDFMWLAQSEIVILATLRESDVMTTKTFNEILHPDQWVRERLRVRLVGAQFVELSLPSSGSPDTTALLQALAECAVGEFNNRLFEERARRLESVTRVAEGLQVELVNKQSQLEQLERAVADHPGVAAALDARLATCRVEMLETAARLARRQAAGSAGEGVVDELQQRLEELQLIVNELEAARAKEPRSEAFSTAKLQRQIERLEERWEALDDRVFAYRMHLENSPPMVELMTPPATLREESWLGAQFHRFLGD